MPNNDIDKGTQPNILDQLLIRIAKVAEQRNLSPKPDLGSSAEGTTVTVSVNSAEIEALLLKLKQHKETNLGIEKEQMIGKENTSVILKEFDVAKICQSEFRETFEDAAGLIQQLIEKLNDPNFVIAKGLDAKCIAKLNEISKGQGIDPNVAKTCEKAAAYIEKILHQIQAGAPNIEKTGSPAAIQTKVISPQK